MNAENNRGFTGPPGGGQVGDRDSRSPGSEAARGTDPRGGAAGQRHERIPHQRETAEMSPHDFGSEDTVN